MEDLFIYIDYVEPKLLCPLCSNPFQNPITLGCKHTFCSECVFGWVSVTSPPISPPPQFDTRSILSKQSKVSRKEPNSGSKLNNKQKEPKAISLDQALNNTYSNNNNSTRSSHSRNNSILPDLDLFCPLCKSSSKEYYSTEAINQELEELRVKCLTCEEILPKKNFNFHLENECLERFIQCPHPKCTQQVSRKNMRRHAEMCHYQYTMSDRSSIISSTINTVDISQSDENAIDLKECEPGVVFEYYRGEFDQLPNFDQLVPNSVGVLQNISIGPLTEKSDFLEPDCEVSDLELGNFAIKYTFYLNIPKSGSHLFYLESNDGSELFVENMQKPIISNDGVHYNKEKEGKVSLNKGKHKVVITYFHKNGKLRESSTLGPFLSFKYYSSDPYWPIKSNFNKELIPDNMLFYHPSDLLAEYKSQADRMVSVSKNALSMRQLQLQLEVANSTISSLEQMVHALTITTEEKLVNMGKALEEEQNKRLELVERISQLRLFSPPTQQQTNGGSDEAPPEQATEEEFLGQFDVQRHVDEVDNLKKLYFHALALCIKMNIKSKSPGSEDPNLPEVSLQALYEQCVIYNELPVDCWPGFISRNLTAHPKQKQSKFSLF